MIVGPLRDGPHAGFIQRVLRRLVGAPRDVEDPNVFHRVSLIAFLAWVGLGADGLSSSSYGPDEAFRALLHGGDHRYLAVALAVATGLTVFIISYAYSRIIEHFPSGGGGYVVATRLLGKRAGVVSGSALIVDYVLTISTSVASGADALFSNLPASWHGSKLGVELFAILVLVFLNLRGVRESVLVLTPIFLTFLVLHATLIGGALLEHVGRVGQVAHEVTTGFGEGYAELGAWGLFLLFARAYSLGGGTYTGIEAVSNGLGIMREPRVQTGKRTMVYMATSLAITAGGILLCYLLVDAHPVDGKTLNAVLAEKFSTIATNRGLPLGKWFVWAVLLSETALLFVAAQTGFIDGPRIMSNMALDGWLPRSFASLSDRLSMQNGVILMGLAAAATLVYTGGSITALVTMYSINVFLTFSLSQLGMCRFWVRHRKRQSAWKRHLPVHLAGLALCATILIITTAEKFTEGGWLTLLVTGLVILLCFAIKRHYEQVGHRIAELDTTLSDIPTPPEAGAPPPLDPTKPTAVLLVGRYSGLGIHSFLTVLRMYPGFYKNFVFLSVAVVDTHVFTSKEDLDAHRRNVMKDLEQYVGLANRLGFAARAELEVGTEVVEEVVSLARRLSREFPRAHFFAGRLVFESESWYYRLLHNETAEAIARRLQLEGIATLTVPIRVFAKKSRRLGETVRILKPAGVG